MCLGILKITFIIIKKKKQATVKIKQELELSEFSLLHLFIYFLQLQLLQVQKLVITSFFFKHCIGFLSFLLSQRFFKCILENYFGLNPQFVFPQLLPGCHDHSV